MGNTDDLRNKARERFKERLAAQEQQAPEPEPAKCIPLGRGRFFVTGSPSREQVLRLLQLEA